MSGGRWVGVRMCGRAEVRRCVCVRARGDRVSFMSFCFRWKRRKTSLIIMKIILFIYRLYF